MLYDGRCDCPDQGRIILQCELLPDWQWSPVDSRQPLRSNVLVYPNAFYTVRRKAQTWRSRPLAERLWFAPAFLLLGITRLAILAVPFRLLAPLLGQNLQTAAYVPLANTHQANASAHIGYAIQTAARYTPWDSKCLAQALTARILLGVKRLPHAIFLGVGKDQHGELIAHAWVCAGAVAVTGGRGFGQYAVVATFVLRGLLPVAQQIGAAQISRRVATAKLEEE